MKWNETTKVGCFENVSTSSSDAMGMSLYLRQVWMLNAPKHPRVS